jgi:flagellar hook assembly protein FlgD
MGDFRAVEPPAAALDALVRTLAWRLDLAHVDPLSTFNGISAGNERFGPGIPVFLRAISGHRDTGATTCPGERLFARLPDIARRVAASGLPKLYAPSAAVDESGGVRFRGRVSASLPWTVVVTDAAGLELGRGSGTGTGVDWTWRPTAPVPAGAQWRIEVPGATAAQGALAGSATTTLQLTGAAASPATISPNGDGQADAATISFTLTVDANVTVSVLDASGAVVAELESRRWRRAGARTATFDGAGLADGAYVVRVDAQATGGRLASADVPVLVTRTLGRVTLSGPALTPNGDGRTDTVSIAVPVASPATLTVRVFRGDRWVATPFAAAVDAGEHAVSWDGTKRLGKAGDGEYRVVVEALDVLGTTRVELPLLLDGTAPRLQLVSAAPPRLRVSEPATLVLLANGARRTVRVAQAGTVRIPRVERLRTLVAIATDAAGNRTLLRR